MKTCSKMLLIALSVLCMAHEIMGIVDTSINHTGVVTDKSAEYYTYEQTLQGYWLTIAWDDGTVSESKVSAVDHTIADIGSGVSYSNTYTPFVVNPEMDINKIMFQSTMPQWFNVIMFIIKMTLIVSGLSWLYRRK